ncbi:unnamed protein product, partial [Allacma fusca]
MAKLDESPLVLVHAYLPGICDAGDLRSVMDEEPATLPTPVYPHPVEHWTGSVLPGGVPPIPPGSPLHPPEPTGWFLSCDLLKTGCECGFSLLGLGGDPLE